MKTKPRYALSVLLALCFVIESAAQDTAADAVKKDREPRGATPVPDIVETVADIVYKTVDGQSIALDLYRLKGKSYENAPLIIWTHGGGFAKGSKEGAVKHNSAVMLPLLLQHGYLVASLDYRLCTPDNDKVRVVQCMTDCKDAVRFLVKNSARYGINPARIVTIGSSAGGGIALVLAMSGDADLPGDSALAKYSAPIKCAVSWFGPTDMREMGKTRPGRDRSQAIFTTVNRNDPHQTEIISAMWYMEKRTAKVPMLLVHGDSDLTVLPRQSSAMKAGGDRLGFPIDYVPVKNMRHGFNGTDKGPITPTLDEIWQTTVAFILKNNGGEELPGGKKTN